MPRELRHPAARPGCRDCGGLGLVVARQDELAVARACACVGVCPLCQGTGLVASGESFRAPRRRCACQAVAQRARSFDAVGIPARHSDSTRASFVTSSKHQTAVQGAISRWLTEFDPGRENRGFVLYGEVGRGKTHLMVALLRELVLLHGVSARFVEFSHLLADLKAGFDAGRGAAELLDPLVRVEVLAIDELGKGRNTEFEATVVDELVSRRYNAMRPLLATTNYTPAPPTGRPVANAAEAQLGTAVLPTLADRVGDRVMSRLRETCDFVEVKGDDWRETSRGRRPRAGTR
ncbi:MAG: ATP-binding protein [Myxococcales bacterium]|nr:ATP-binding protein [Myxococcales bacterium]